MSAWHPEQIREMEEELESRGNYNDACEYALAEIRRLRARVEQLEESNQMACEEPDPRCECSGCLYARECGGARALEPEDV